MALKIVRRYDANGNVIEDKDLERFRLDSQWFVRYYIR